MPEEWIARVIDSGIALAVLVWIVNMGQQQMKTLYSDHYAMTQRLIDTLTERNQQLTDTLISCISSVSQPCKDKE